MEEHAATGGIVLRSPGHKSELPPRRLFVFFLPGNLSQPHKAIRHHGIPAGQGIAGKKEYLQAAKRAQEFIEGNLADGNILYVSCAPL